MLRIITNRIIFILSIIICHSLTKPVFAHEKQVTHKSKKYSIQTSSHAHAHTHKKIVHKNISHKKKYPKKTKRYNKKFKKYKIKTNKNKIYTLNPSVKPSVEIKKTVSSVGLINTNNTSNNYDNNANYYHFHNPHLIKRSIVFAQNTKAELVASVHRAISSLRYTHYQFGGTYFNMARGIYEVDCSEYVDRLLNLAFPRAYDSLVNSMHTEKPTSEDYYDFFTHLPEDTTNHNWEKIDDVNQLKAGDIIVFRYNDRHDVSGGHVMIVMDTPLQDSDDPNAYDIKISDSAAARHSDDTRSPHTSGIGIGTLMLKVNPDTHEPDAYAWTADSDWKHIDAAMAEPVNTTNETKNKQ